MSIGYYVFGVLPKNDDFMTLRFFINTGPCVRAANFKTVLLHLLQFYPISAKLHEDIGYRGGVRLGNRPSFKSFLAL